MILEAGSPIGRCHQGGFLPRLRGSQMATFSVCHPLSVHPGVCLCVQIPSSQEDRSGVD